MRRIVDDRWPVKYPPYMSAAGRDLIMRLLERKPAKRIGMLQGRANDIKQHEWFRVSAQGLGARPGHGMLAWTRPG
jgi:cGMP-dependent protein kinase 2